MGYDESRQRAAAALSVITLVSGGLDSTLMAALSAEAEVQQYPLFIDYGQRSAERELASVRRSMSRLGLEPPHVADLKGFGKIARSGLTDSSMDVFIDAFTPGRNLLFVIAGAAYAVTRGASAVAIGLLNEKAAIFPDQTADFLKRAEDIVSLVMGRPLRVIAPLMHCTKADVIALSDRRGIGPTYSCHTGRPQPCGVCVACREFQT